jgi:nucleotide-binding universal stress UspA family protein
MFDTIVWASDGSVRGDRSLPVVREICARYADSLRIVHVVERLPGRPLLGVDVHACEDRVVAKLKGPELGSVTQRLLAVAPCPVWSSPAPRQTAGRCPA